MRDNQFVVNYLTSPAGADMANAETNGGLCTFSHYPRCLSCACYNNDDGNGKRQHMWCKCACDKICYIIDTLSDMCVKMTKKVTLAGERTLESIGFNREGKKSDS